MPKQSEAAPQAFDGFAPGAFDFLTDLDAHQTREWFLAHKDRYEQTIRDPLGRLVASLSLAFAAHDVPLTGDAKASLFRINRDVRFANDKRPYKTNASAVLTRDGSKRSQGLVYLQFGPDACFAAAGFYALEPDALGAVRHHILAHRSEWIDIERALEARGLPLARDDIAARLPRGFDAATVGDLDDAVRLKSFIVRRPLDPADVATHGLVDRIVDVTQAALPLLNFGWAALARA